jgi:DNA polymerase III delta prime subunit
MVPTRPVPKDMTSADSLGLSDSSATDSVGDLPTIYRPRRFDQVLGQVDVKRPLAQMLVDGRLPRTLLFSGPSGTGKTSVARIVAASVVCSDRTDADPCGACGDCAPVLFGRFSFPVWEINAARDGGIDDVRRLQDHLGHAYPWRQVVLWDEAHRITREACDALLKTLEETPQATFILITTDPVGLPPTIRSRATPFLFERVATSEIAAHVSRVASDRSWRVSKSLVGDVAAASDGSPRKALQLLELAISGGRVPNADGIRELGSHLVVSAAESNFMRAHVVLEELLGLVEPPGIRDACVELVFGALSGSSPGRLSDFLRRHSLPSARSSVDQRFPEGLKEPRPSRDWSYRSRVSLDRPS